MADPTLPEAPPADHAPATILAFDRDKFGPKPVDLEQSFFTVVETTPSGACNHREAGVVLDLPTRTVECKCGARLDTFDALLIYARAQQRLISTKAYIQEQQRKAEEKKAKRRFVKRATQWESVTSSRGRHLGWRVLLECGHTVSCSGKRQPQRMTCDECFQQSLRPRPGKAAPGATGAMTLTERNHDQH